MNGQAKNRQEKGIKNKTTQARKKLIFDDNYKVNTGALSSVVFLKMTSSVIIPDDLCFYKIYILDLKDVLKENRYSENFVFAFQNLM